MKNTDLDIRYEEIDTNNNGDLSDELWRRLYDELFAPDADDRGETYSILKDNVPKSKKISGKRTSATYAMLE